MLISSRKIITTAIGYGGAASSSKREGGGGVLGPAAGARYAFFLNVRLARGPLDRGQPSLPPIADSYSLWRGVVQRGLPKLDH